MKLCIIFAALLVFIVIQKNHKIMAEPSTETKITRTTRSKSSNPKTTTIGKNPKTKAKTTSLPIAAIAVSCAHDEDCEAGYCIGDRCVPHYVMSDHGSDCDAIGAPDILTEDQCKMAAYALQILWKFSIWPKDMDFGDHKNT